MNDAYPDARSLEILGVVVGDPAVAREAIAHYGSLLELARAPARELQRIPGLGPARARRIRAAFDLGKEAAAERVRPGKTLTCPADVHAALGPTLVHEQRELLVVVGLDARNRVRVVHQVATGTLTRCASTPRDIFLPVLRESAAHLILVHNHPSGDPEPSPDDIALTLRVRDAGRLLGITVLDHVVVATEGYVSLADRALL